MLNSLKRALGRRKEPELIPYDMFDLERAARQAKSAHVMERIYHKGQAKAWDGKELLASLVEKHGGIHLPPDRLAALRRMMAIIFWGELAAWKVAADLSLHIEPLEAKMAATSQAHDEARHFYVLHDYLELIGYRPEPLPGVAHQILDRICRADTLAMKVVGMLMMVEPIALTLFHMIRKHRTEPVLADLLGYYEKDEARHIALGVHYLPELLEEQSLREAVGYWRWQLGMIRLEIQGLRDLEDDFRTLGFEPRDVYSLGQGKQLLAMQMMSESMGDTLPVAEAFSRISNFLVEYHFPLPGQSRGFPSRLRRGLAAALDTNLEAETATSLAGA